MNRLETFDIRNFQDRLNILKEESTQLVCECLVCGGHRLTIDKKLGKYQCWSGGCTSADIREAIRPWSEVVGNTQQSARHTQPRKPSKTSISVSAPIPAGDLKLALLPTSADIPPRLRRLDSLRGEVWEIQYPYSDTQWVQRTEWVDPSKPKGCDKKILPYNISGEGEVKCSKGDQTWPLYRFNDVEQYGAGKWVTFLEGEKCVECCRWLQLVGTTLQGGSWTGEALDSAIVQMKQAGIAGVVYLPDPDEAGRKKAQKVALAAAKAGIPLLIIEPLALWEDMPEAGDIADWAKWGRAQGMERNDFIRRLEEEIHAAAALRIEEQKQNDPDERLRLDLHALLKESDPIKRMRRRSEIASYYRLNKSEIDEALKELRQRNVTPEPTFFSLGDFLTQSEGYCQIN